MTNIISFYLLIIDLNILLYLYILNLVANRFLTFVIFYARLRSIISIWIFLVPHHYRTRNADS